MTPWTTHVHVYCAFACNDRRLNCNDQSRWTFLACQVQHMCQRATGYPSTGAYWGPRAVWAAATTQVASIYPCKQGAHDAYWRCSTHHTALLWCDLHLASCAAVCTCSPLLTSSPSPITCSSEAFFTTGFLPVSITTAGLSSSPLRVMCLPLLSMVTCPGVAPIQPQHSKPQEVQEAWMGETCCTAMRFAQTV